MTYTSARLGEIVYDCDCIPEPSEKVSNGLESRSPQYPYIELLPLYTQYVDGKLSDEHDRDGLVVSNTVIVKLQEEAKSAQLTALHVTVVVPRLNFPPESDVQLEDLMPPGAVTTGENVGVIQGLPDVGEVLMFAGHEIVGGVVRVLLTKKLHEAAFCAVSVAVHVTLARPRGKE